MYYIDLANTLTELGCVNARPDSVYQATCYYKHDKVVVVIDITGSRITVMDYYGKVTEWLPLKEDEFKDLLHTMLEFTVKGSTIDLENDSVTTNTIQ